MYQQEIQTYMRRHAVFTTGEIRESLHIPRDKWPSFNVEMQRLCQKGTIVRFQKGVYGRPTAETMDFLQHLYLHGGGYLRGDEQHPVIVSNAVGRNGSRHGVGLRRPKAAITHENSPYFAILDKVQDVSAIAREPENASKAIREEVNRQGLDWARLIALANRYYQKRVVAEVNGYVEEEYA